VRPSDAARRALQPLDGPRAAACLCGRCSESSRMLRCIREPSERTKFMDVNFGERLLEATVDGIIYLVGLIVIIMFILSLLGLH
jgi:hypothetical protein